MRLVNITIHTEHLRADNLVFEYDGKHDQPIRVVRAAIQEHIKVCNYDDTFTWASVFDIPDDLWAKWGLAPVNMSCDYDVDANDEYVMMANGEE